MADTQEVEVEDQVEAEEGQESPPEAEEEAQEPVSIHLGDEESPKEETVAAPEWVKDLRRQRRELIKENQELKRRVASSVPAAPSAPQVGKKPSISDTGIDYDAEKFEQKLLEWNEQKRQADQYEAQTRQAQQQEENAWQQELGAYETAKKRLRLDDFEEAEVTVAQILSPQQQGIIVHAAALPAELIYALGTNPGEAKKLAEIKDPVKFAFAIAKLEVTKLKVTKKESIPGPERRISGSAPISGATDTRLEQLRREAERTGDSSKVVAYKRTLKKR